MKNTFIVSTLLYLCFASCAGNTNNDANTQTGDSATTQADTTKKGTATAGAPAPGGPIANAATILARTEVPVLCYHHIKEIKPGDGEITRTYTVTPGAFASQMKALSDSGYHSVLPDELYNYLAYGTPLPEKPVMITFDDTDAEQFTLGAAEMKKYGFKGVFFIMTISINKPRYMTKEQIKELSDDGHQIASHTWDHNRVTKYTGEDWDIQTVKTRKTLEDITGKPIHYFAYPFGLWNAAAIPALQQRDYKMAFILSTKRDSLQPLHTVRRIIVAGQWSTPGMLKAMRTSFKG
jgi:peptidoglycan/xylan/chitin deacetylase (PgdA/CDA1 family)